MKPTKKLEAEILKLRNTVQRNARELENKNRELEIEASLDRVRVRAMAMKASNELADLIALIHSEMSRLDKHLDRCFIMLFNKKDDSTWWMAANEKMPVKRGYYIPNHNHSPYLAILEGWKKKRSKWTYVLKGVAKKRWDNFIFTKTELMQLPKAAKANMTAAKLVNLDASFNRYGCILSGSYEPLGKQSVDLMVRFSRMFEQTYTRFLDLQKAEAQTREAQIEVALEKIRSRSLAMHSSNELSDVIGVVFSQLNELKVLHGTVGIQLFDFKTKDSTFWPGNTLQTPAPKVRFPFDEKILNGDNCHRDIWQAMLTGRTIFNKVYTKKQKDRYFKYVFANNSLDLIFEQSRKIILGWESFTLCFIPEKNSGLYADSVDGSVYSDEEFMVLKRTAKVFEQAYTRFLDLQRAEVQAREAQIEAALEKVRARTMAMQRSDELADVAVLLFRQVQSLGVRLWSCGFNIWQEGDKDFMAWMSSPDNRPSAARIPFTEHPYFIRFKESRQNGIDYWTLERSGRDLAEFYRYLLTIPLSGIELKAFLESGGERPTRQIDHVVNFLHGNLIFITYDAYPDAHDVFKRFGKVFEQTYTRFLDLQKAEDQAREAQIEAALERVRSRTMAMQRSNELGDAALLLFQQIQALGGTSWACGYNIWDEDRRATTAWMARGAVIQRPFKVPANKDVFLRFYEAAQRGESLYVEEISGKVCDRHYKFMRTLPVMTDIMKEWDAAGIKAPKSQIFHIAFFSQGYLMFITYEPVPDLWDVFKRFAKVFEQTYTRFLDLQKVEEQARESQIQLALERVRARTMAMQKSNELSDVATLLFQQVRDLGIKAWTAGFNVWSDDGNSYTDYIASPQGNLIQSYTIDATKFSVFIDVANARRSGAEFWVSYLEGDLLKQTYRELARFDSVAQYQKMLDEAAQYPAHQYNHFVFGSKVSLMFITYDAVPEAHDIFKRFGKVFEQTYTRFLDLQRVESQARESQIQLAMERLRARTMAMHFTLELSEVAEVLFAQLKDLGVALWGCGFNICRPDSDLVERWMCRPDGKMMEPLLIPLSVNQFEQLMYDAWKNGSDLITYEQGGRDLEEGFERLKDHPSSEIIYKRLKEIETAGNIQMPTELKHYVSSFKQGYLWIMTTKGFEETQIFVRFAKVFEQTYTRFLDLKRAEEQAREAQIEGALEKIRSRSLAMHHSDELKEVMVILYRNLVDLRVLSETQATVAIQLFDRDAKDSTFWPINNPNDEPKMVLLPFDEAMMAADTCHRDLWQAMDNGRVIFNKVYSKEQKDRWFDYVFTHNDNTRIAPRDREFIRKGEIHTVCFVPEKNSGLFVDTWDGSRFAEEDIDVLKRAARVFEQAYTRFLDLKKAEAQAREAQIEAALERVRSRTMAMHKSEELLEVINVVCEQLQHLGIKFGTVSFGKNSTSFDMDFWVAAPDLRTPIKICAPYADISIYRRLKAAHSERKTFFTDTFNADEIRVWYQHVFDHNPSMFSQKSREYLLSRQAMTRSAVLLKNVILFIINHDIVTYSEEENEIFIRFATVFEQAYTRFLDLQKAEAQAREAQIETALERLRSRTMAMQRSTELSEVSQLLHQQFLFLEVQNITCAFMFPDEEKKTQSGWTVLPDGTLLPRLLDFPLFGDDILNKRFDSWKQKELLHRRTLDVGENRRHHQFLSGQVASHISKDIFTQLPDDQITFTSANFAQGYLMLFTRQPLSGDGENILCRFAKVFEQTYTRFLDLQKAEAQAREAQVQLALERIRARTMAMHQSKEVREVAVIISDQLKQLGFGNGFCSIILIDGNTGDLEWWMGGFGEMRFQESYFTKNFDHPAHRAMVDGFVKQDKFRFFEVSGADKRAYDDGLFIANGFENLPDGVEEWMRSMDAIEFSLAYYRHGALHWGVEKLTDEKADILQRFAAVFEQSYTRFLDLQKAEALAREAQIEVALERVRARAMAMHTAQELKEVVHELRKQIGLLGDRGLETVAIHLNDELPDVVRAWAGSRRGDEIKEFVMDFPKKGLVIIEEALKSYYKGERDYQVVGDGTKLKQWWEFIFSVLPDAHEFFGGTWATDETLPHYMTFADFQGGSLLISTLEQPNPDTQALLRRFSNVFGLAYRRFSDLRQAEAQAREARIEAALERVRSRTMAMRKSSELSETASLLFKQVGELGIKGWTAGFNVWSDDNNSYTDYVVDPQGEIMEPYVVDTTECSVFKEIAEARRSGEEFFVQFVEGEKLVQGYQYLSKYADKGQFQKIISGGNAFPTKQYDHFVFGTKVSLIFITYEPVPEFHDIFKRFGRVFEQTYTRFLDLQKAEAQAREAQIEAALEKIRSRSLGMHKSEEIKDVVAILFEKLKELGLVFDGGAAIHLFAEGSRDASILVMAPQLTEPIRNSLPHDEEFANNPIIIDVWKAKETGQHIVNKHYSFEEKNSYFDYVFKHNDHLMSQEVKDFIRSARSYTANFIAEKNSLIGASSWTGQSFSENDIDVLKRVARVFEQAYIRFLDLQKAEVQAREATIEAALEKIRSRSLGMHRSEEIKEVVSILYEKLKELGLVFDGGAGIHTFLEGTRDSEMWVLGTDHNISVRNNHPYDKLYEHNPILQDIWKAKDTGEHIVNRHYSFHEKNEFFEYISKHNHSTKVPETLRKAVYDAPGYTATFVAEKNSLLSADSFSGQIFSASDVDILKRVAHVFDQAFVRFLDLQKAEAHTRDAVRQASLDRVRAEIASMRKVEDLDRITPLIWRELKALEIPFIRCGVFITDDVNQVIHNFLSTPDGEAIKFFQLPYNTPGFITRALEHWREKKILVDHWEEEKMKQHADILVNEGIYASPEQYLSTLPAEGFYLHILPFLQGMLYVGSLTPLVKEDLTVVGSLAEAFSTAYARYDDFNRLELAKKQVDATLLNLKQAQQQLVQSEKMASLGELTAGIAHEIQNPLNFVNNFSEVSHELMDEMKAEIEAGNVQAAIDLLNDIKQNLEKITHHGKRADGIVKGMLQHSRSGSGQKESTDINLLCDEYVRLAYHGYRAKDKSFNASFEANLDAALPKISVVAQDIGRVILNLINNAFYAVNEKSKTQKDGYMPKVIVSTRCREGGIEIRVEDNGPGMTKSVREKVFQPFFTTKPTGQGTGLGLSLSYDIIKVHGGTLEVNSKEGEGAEFVIRLSI